jgi:predicted nucleotidyltransferase
MEQLKSPLTLDELRARGDEIIALAECYGAYNIRVFGSVARGDATSHSDVDLLVSWDYARVSAWGGIGFDLELNQLLDVRVDVISENGLSPLLRKRVLSEAVLI